MMKNYRVMMVSEGNAKLEEGEVRELAPHEVLVRNMFTGVSAGTERAWSLSMPNAKSNFPYMPGYSGSGEVVQVGSSVKNLSVGDRVVVNWAGHQLYSILGRSDLVKIPEGIDMMEACFAHISSFPMLGVRKLQLELGESCMVLGLGILGVFAIQFARLSGAIPLFAADFSPERRKLALELGVDKVFDPADPDYPKQVKELTGGKGVDAIVEVTGNAAALQTGLTYVARNGRISLLGCTRISDAPIDFYKYVHCPGIRLIGSHTMTRPKYESSPFNWTEPDDYNTFLKLLAAKRIQVKPLISTVVSPTEAHNIYHMLATTKNPPLGLVFDWTTMV
jgi:threonine dehydrogenase-like Zn-dependent dehydrogenase